MGLKLASQPFILAHDPTVIIEDQFGGGNLDPSKWAVVAGTWSTDGGKGYCVTDTDSDIAVVDARLADILFDITCVGAYDTTNHRQFRPIIGYIDALNMLQIDVWGTAGNIRLIKVDGGSGSVLAQAARTAADGTPISWRITKTGNVIKVYEGGTLRITHTLSGGDTKYATPTKVGVFVAKTGTPAVTATMDDFVVRRGV